MAATHGRSCCRRSCSVHTETPNPRPRPEFLRTNKTSKEMATKELPKTAKLLEELPKSAKQKGEDEGQNSTLLTTGNTYQYTLLYGHNSTLLTTGYAY